MACKVNASENFLFFSLKGHLWNIRISGSIHFFSQRTQISWIRYCSFFKKRWGMQTKPSGQLCKTDIGWILGEGGEKLVSKPVALFSWQKSWNCKVTSSELAVNTLYLSLLPRLLAVPAVTPEAKWAAEADSSPCRKVWAIFLAWASLCWWFEENQLVVPCAVPTRCIERGLQPEAGQVASFTSTEFVFRTFCC